MIIKEEICKELNDDQLVRLSLTDINYFLFIYNRYKPRLLRYIEHISRVSKEQAEDILQDAFIKVWQNLKGYDPSLKFSSWLYRIVHNETVSNWRKSCSFQKNKKAQLNENLRYESVENLRSIFDLDHTEQQVHELLDCLSLNYKTVLYLKYFKDMSYREISDVLKIPEGTVAVQLNRAKKQFEKLIKEKKVSFET